MKTKLKIKLTLSGLLLTFMISFTANSQGIWEKYPDNSVFESFAPWAVKVFSPVVLYEDDTYKMWFSGDGSGTLFYSQIGYAESNDGITWTPLNDPVIQSGIQGDWNRGKTLGSVLLVNDTLKIWYAGSSDNFNSHSSIGYAWSVGNNDWNLEVEPVLEKGESGEWDATGVYKPVVYFDGNLYHMWYHGWTGISAYAPGEIGYAISEDGINWVKDTVNNSVLRLGEDGNFYDTWVIPGSILYVENKYHLWFSGWDGSNNNPMEYMRIGYATSPDGINWTVHNEEMPVLDVGQDGDWDERMVRYCSVLMQEGQYKMWFGGSDYSNTKIGYATCVPFIHVPGDQTTIQAGIDAALDGSVVLVDEGTYYENINFKSKAITVASHFLIDGDTNHISSTIIDGSQPANRDSASVVYFVSGEDTTSIITGFTIQGGSGTPSSWGNGISGGGIFCAQANPTIDNNYIINNHCDGGGDYVSGGGVFCDGGSDGMVIIRNNLISENSCISNQSGTYAVTGGGISSVNDAIITGNTITNNSISHGANKQAVGGGVECSYCKAIIINNTISGNNVQNTSSAKTPWGGGIYSEESEEGSVISGNLITLNIVNGIMASSSGAGIGLWNNEGNITIDKNEIRNNESDYGAGITLGLIQGVEITNNVIQGNDAEIRGGGIYLRHGSYYDRRAVRGFEMNTNNTLKRSLSGNSIPVIANNTIVENSCSQTGGGISSEFTSNSFVAFNNIIFDNTGASLKNEIYLSFSADAYLYNNDIDTAKIYGTGNWEGEANIFVDPKFIDPDSGNYCIDSCDNLCIGSGIDSLFIEDQGWFYAPDHDISGRHRPIPTGSQPDIGAYEVDSCVISNVTKFTISNFKFQAYPNPCSSAIHLQFEINNQQLTILNLYEITGVKIKQLLNEIKMPGNYELELDLSDLPAGVYFCTLITDSGVETVKLIKL